MENAATSGRVIYQYHLPDLLQYAFRHSPSDRIKPLDSGTSCQCTTRGIYLVNRRSSPAFEFLDHDGPTWSSKQQMAVCRQ